MFFFDITVFQGCKETDLNSYTKGQEVVNNGPFIIYLVNSPKYIHKKYRRQVIAISSIKAIKWPNEQQRKKEIVQITFIPT